MGERVVSSKEKEKIVIDPNMLLVQAQELAKYIEALRNALAGVETTRVNLTTAKETIEALSEVKEDIFIPGDHGGIIYFKAKPTQTDKVLLHLGREYYAVLPVDKAKEKIESRLASLEKQERELRKKLDEALQQYQAVQSLIQQVAIAMRQQKTGQITKK